LLPETQKWQCSNRTLTFPLDELPGKPREARTMAKADLVPLERIERAILLIRGQKVMLDRDLAELYGVATKVLNQAVRRNRNRFPEDFMFQLSHDEFANWRSQFVTSNSSIKMGSRRRPYAFTEQGET
jgi:hypothetical protein